MLYGPALFFAGMVAFAISVICSLAERLLFLYAPSKVEVALKDPDQRKRLEPYADRLDDLAFSASILNVLAHTLFVMCAGYYVLSHGGALWQGSLGMLGALAVSLVLGEVIPRAIAGKYVDTALLGILPWISGLDRVFVPVVFPLRRLYTVLAKKVDGPVTRKEIADEIRSATIEGEREGVLDEDDASMIASIIEFKDVEVSEIMTPRTDMVALQVEATLADAIRLVIDKGHSRVPVYEGSRDKIVGVVYAKDILKQLKINGETKLAEVTLKELMRGPFFVPETKPIHDLLKEFQKRRVHMAILLDEYGGTAGLVTIEDIVEEIVGEIEDEYDPNLRPQIQRAEDGTADVDAKLHIDEVNEELGLDLPDGDYDTLGGLVMSELGKVPSTGEELSVGEVRMTVLDADQRRITRVRIEHASLVTK